MWEIEGYASGDDVFADDQALTNNDFRKLFMTPRGSPSPARSTDIMSEIGGYAGCDDMFADDQELTNNDFRKLFKTPCGSSFRARSTNSYTRTRVVVDDSRKKKKTFYATLKKAEEDKMKELASKYRDRTRERRDGSNPDYQNKDPVSTMARYGAVATDAKSTWDAAERRRQAIYESKFMGGDMEHTHLVKGLDYALLQKVRSEITTKEVEENELEEVVKVSMDKAEDDDRMEFKTELGRNIYKAVFKNKVPERNELFMPGRLAYVMDLENEFESDIPTTLIRSKCDCPSVESQTILSTNDIVINKLAQILSYLRQGTRNSKKTKRTDRGPTKNGDKGNRAVEESIFGEIGDYVPQMTKSKASKRVHGSKTKDSKGHAYFKMPSAENDWDIGGTPDKFSLKSLAKDASKVAAAAAISREITSGFGTLPKRGESKIRRSKIPAKSTQPESYAECYPGAPEMADAIEDSDDEVDYTKMDMGNKKGPIGRWDFDTQDEYGDYMNKKEAMPKAAFQYGVKLGDGRKTRRAVGEKDKKAELDREWQNIIAERKSLPGDGNETGAKKPKYSRNQHLKIRLP